MVQFPGNNNATWLYYNGIYADVLANLPAGLGVNDIYYTFQATDYLHNWVWNGNNWHFDPNGQGSGYTIFANNGVLPYGVWGLFDGNTYAVSKDDATTFNYTTSVLANTYIRR